MTFSLAYHHEQGRVGRCKNSFEEESITTSSIDEKEAASSRNLAGNDNDNNDKNNNGELQAKSLSSKRKSSSLMDTHANVLALLESSDLVCVSKSPASAVDNLKDETETNKTSCQRLRDLRQQRVYLASEVALARSQSQLSNVDLLRPTIHDCFSNSSRQVGSDATSKASSSSIHLLQDAATELDSFFASSSHEPVSILSPPSSLAMSLQQVRTKRKLVAAYRLGGITAAVPHADPEVLSIRFDICLGEGSYVASYHAFFDLIVETNSNKKEQSGSSNMRKASTDTNEMTDGNHKNTSSEQRDMNDSNKNDTDNNSNGSDASILYLRLVQHTIPSAIPVLTLCKTILGGFLFSLGDLHKKEDWKTDDLKERIRSWCRQIYRACWCWERRKQDWACLEKHQKRTQQKGRASSPSPGGNKDRNRIHVENLTTTASDSLRQISFHLSRAIRRGNRHPNASWGLGVQLMNDDWVRGQPSSVDVEIIHQPPSSQGSVQATPSMTNNQKKVLDLVQTLFLNKPVNGALEFLQDHELWMD